MHKGNNLTRTEIKMNNRARTRARINNRNTSQCTMHNERMQKNSKDIRERGTIS